MKNNTIQIISPTWIAPVVPSNLILNNHSLVIEGDHIKALLPNEVALKNFPHAQELRLNSHLITPGFINTHGHAAMALLRGVADDKDMMDWLTNWVWPIESKMVNQRFVYDGTRLAALEMIMAGTTCAAESYFFPEEASKAFVQANLRAQVTIPILKFANAWAGTEKEHISKGLAFLDRIKNNPLISTAFAPHAPYSVTDQCFSQIRIYSEQLDLPVHLHLHETETEVSDSLREHGMRPIERMNKLGILSPSLQAVHMTQLLDDEIELAALTGVQISHCPESNMKLASGVTPIAQLMSKGINVAIGTDGAASNNDLDLLQETRTASLLSKATTSDAKSMSAFTCLEMMTINGARFLGLDDKVGSLERGKLADVTAIDLSHPALQPIYNPISQLIYNSSSRDVSHVWIGGKKVLESRKLLGVNADDVISTAQQWQKRISKVMGKPT